MRAILLLLSHWINSIIIGSIRSYQYLLSPLMPSSCRFWPTCSEYSIQSFNRFGLLRGLLLTLLRLLKCQPFHPGGYDPVPPLNLKKSKGNKVL